MGGAKEEARAVMRALEVAGGGGGEVPGGEDWAAEGETAGLGRSPKMSSKAMATDTKLEDE